MLFLAMSPAAKLMEHSSAGRDGRVLRLLWDVYRAPPMLILGSLRYILPFPEFMFVGPLIALFLGLATTCFA
jgi:hypothetical protein